MLVHIFHSERPRDRTCWCISSISRTLGTGHAGVYLPFRVPLERKRWLQPTGEADSEWKIISSFPAAAHPKERRANDQVYMWLEAMTKTICGLEPIQRRGARQQRRLSQSNMLGEEGSSCSLFLPSACHIHSQSRSIRTHLEGVERRG